MLQTYYTPQKYTKSIQKFTKLQKYLLILTYKSANLRIFPRKEFLLQTPIYILLRHCWQISWIGKFELAKKAKELGLDAIHDTVHEMARDEARYGMAFEGAYKRFFG